MGERADVPCDVVLSALPRDFDSDKYASFGKIQSSFLSGTQQSSLPRNSSICSLPISSTSRSALFSDFFIDSTMDLSSVPTQQLTTEVAGAFPFVSSFVSTSLIIPIFASSSSSNLTLLATFLSGGFGGGRASLDPDPTVHFPPQALHDAIHWPNSLFLSSGISSAGRCVFAFLQSLKHLQCLWKAASHLRNNLCRKFMEIQPFLIIKGLPKIFGESFAV